MTSPTEPTTEVTTSWMPLMTSEAGAPTMGTGATTAVTVALRLSREVSRVVEIDSAVFGIEAAAFGGEAADVGMEAAAFGIGVADAVGRPALRRPGVRAWPVPVVGPAAVADGSRAGFRPASSAPAMSRTAFRNVSVTFAAGLLSWFDSRALWGV